MEWNSKMQLHDVHQGIQRRKRRKRVGRGPGSGHGKTATKGHKGHSSRQGFKMNPLSEGGGQPLIRRVPKRGFNNGAFKKHFVVLNLHLLESKFEAGSEVTREILRQRLIVKGQIKDGIKILGDGELTKPLVVTADGFSKSAIAKIVQAGGKAIDRKTGKELTPVSAAS